MPAGASRAEPKLAGVDPEPAGAAASAPAPGRPRRGRALGLLLVLLTLAALALALQTRRVSQLAGEVERLGAELTEARSELMAYETQRGRVRGLVANLATSVEQLRELLERDPLASVPPPASEEAL